MDIMTGEKLLCQFRLQYPLALFDRAVYPVGGGGDGVKKGDGGDRYFNPLQSSL